MGALETPPMSVEEYLAADERAEIPSEYHNGGVLQIETASLPHAAISICLGSALLTRLRGTRCVPLAAARLQVTATEYVYPDLAVVCGTANQVDYAGSFDNPKVLFEIFSPSTDGYDHSRKFKLYRLLRTFEEYVLISQHEAYVEVFRKEPDETWVFSTHQGLDASFELRSLGITIPLAEIYATVAL